MDENFVRKLICLLANLQCLPDLAQFLKDFVVFVIMINAIMKNKIEINMDIVSFFYLVQTKIRL